MAIRDPHATSSSAPQSVASRRVPTQPQRIPRNSNAWKPNSPASRQLPPGRRRAVYVWQCCQCGLSGINIQVDTCPECQCARCAYCKTTKIQVRGAGIIGEEIMGVKSEAESPMCFGVSGSPKHWESYNTLMIAREHS